MHTYLTDAEVDAIQSLHKRTPYLIACISHGMFSIARHPEYGGMTYQGDRYTYIDEFDECVRDDVIKAVTKLRRRSAKKAIPPDTQAVLAL